jgi:hypothetical protein
MTETFLDAPNILCVFMNQNPSHLCTTHVDTSVYISVNDRRYEYKLAGITYFGDSHFTSRVVIDDHQCFFYDGMVNQGCFSWAGDLNTSNIVFSRCRSKNASCVFYTYT